MLLLAWASLARRAAFWFSLQVRKIMRLYRWFDHRNCVSITAIINTSRQSTTAVCTCFH